MSYKYYKFFILLALILLNTGCLRFVKYEHGQNKHSQIANKIVTYHQVKSGETLYSIAFEYGRDHRDVAEWNNISKPYTIYPNQKIRIIPIASDAQKKIQYKKIKSISGRSKKVSATAEKHRVDSNKKLTWLWPTQGKVVSTFSYRDPGRRGIDIVGRKGQPVEAAAAGRVVYRGNGLRGYGNLIILKHNETFFSAYAHTDHVVVKENEKVKLGQKLADMGNTGSVKTKLHFEIRRNGKPINPLKYLPKRR